MVIPSHTYSIDIAAPAQEVIDAVRGIVEPYELIRWYGTHKPFQGKVNEFGFRICRVVVGWKTYMLVIHGSCEPHGRRTVVRIKMVFEPFAFVFTCAWVALIVAFGVLSITAQRQPGQPVVTILCCGMLLLGIYTAFRAFWAEVLESKHLLQEVLPSRERIGIE